MSNMKSRSKSSLFLMELIIVIMFFSLCAAICMKVFASAKVKTDFSRDVTNASFVSESVAEYYKEYNGSLSKLAKEYNAKLDKSQIQIFYDKDWKTCSDNSAKYIMTVTEQSKDYVNHILISVKDKDGKDIFSMVSAASTELNGEVQTDGTE